MDEKQLRKLSRIQLLEMLIQKSKEADQLRAELEDAKRQLGAMADAGALAEAARKLSELMESGGAPRQAAEPDRAEADRILAEARAEAERLLAQTRAECEEMVAKAKRDSQRWWAETSKKMDAFYKERKGLREMLAEQYAKKD